MVLIEKLPLTKGIRANLITYFLFILIAVIGSLYGNAIRNDFSFLRVWDYAGILFLLIGLPFLFLQTRAGLPDFWDATVSNKQRWLWPAITGAVFGILDIIVIKLLLHPEPYTEMPPFLQPFPYSSFLYFSGAFEIEIFYRLIPITVILLLGKWYAKGKYFTTFLWTGIVLTSLREPLEQLPDNGVLLVIYSLITGFLMNFIQAVFYKRAGFLASMAVRLGHYLFWHILLGIYVQYFELA